jgi:hypothetical protein
MNLYWVGIGVGFVLGAACGCLWAEDFNFNRKNTDPEAKR